jgi:hypothetical protein
LIEEERQSRDVSSNPYSSGNGMIRRGHGMEYSLLFSSLLFSSLLFSSLLFSSSDEEVVTTKCQAKETG